MEKWSEIISDVDKHWSAFKNGGDQHLNVIKEQLEKLQRFYKINPQGDDRPHRYLNPPKISLDIDDVLAGWVDAWAERHGIKHPVTSWNFDRLMSERFVKMKDDKEFWLSLKPLIKPEDLPFEPHCYITARSIKQEWTEEWLFDVVGYPCAPVYSVGFGNSKVDVAKSAGVDIHVDDAYKNFVELNNAGVCTYLWDTPQNKRYNVGHKRLFDLKDLL